ncbi:MAG: hypothetical protein ACTSYF_09950 [Promethearchaeota archaeon]
MKASDLRDKGKVRIIKLKDPKLRKLRLSLRQVLLKESKKRLLALLDEEKRFLLMDHSRGYDHEYINYLRSITNQKNKLRNELSASIVVCAVCRDIENDHIFSPRDKVWYCLECYNIFEKSYFEEIKALGRLN